MTNNTIAVLPFVNRSSDPENEYFSDGITEEIINALARIEQLKVISRTSSFFFKNKELPLKDIAAELKVAIILEGSVRVAGNMVRISAQLIQATDDFHFWSESWDRKLENIFEIQDEISLLIADKLREQFGHFEIADHLVKKQTENVDAYAYSLKARYHFNKWNPQDVSQAIALWEKAINLDPAHTESYVGLADAYGFLATTEFLPRQEAWAKAVEYTQRAYSLDPDNAGVHYQLANLSFFTDCSFQDAAKHGFRSLELKPNYPEAQQYVSFLYMLCGEMDQAHRHLQLALGIDPFSQETLFYQAYYYYRTDDYAKALEQLEECLAKNPKNIPAFIVRMYCLLMLGRYDTVLHELDQMPPDIVIPDERLGLSCLAYLLKKDDQNGRECLSKLQLEAAKPTSFQAHSYLFLAYANLGRYDEAFDWLDQALKMKSSIFLLSYSDPLVNGLRQDARYAAYHQKLYTGLVNPMGADRKKAALLDEAVAGNLTTKLLNFVQEEQPYLDPNLSLRSLAEQIEIHPNQLSWLLNEQLAQNFNEFVNHRRVDHFKVLARDPANSHISLIGLAFESGFNSKTVFNTFFKKTTGMTPSEFLKSSV